MPASPRRPAFRALLIALALSSSLSACSIEDMMFDFDFCEGVGPLARVELSPNRITLRSGDSVAVTVSQLDAQGNDRFMCGLADLSWSSANLSIASASGDSFLGMIRAAEPGTTTIRAAVSSSYVGTTTVTVVAR